MTREYHQATSLQRNSNIEKLGVRDTVHRKFITDIVIPLY